MTLRKRVFSTAETVIPRGATRLAAAVALLATVGMNSASADVSYTSFTWTGINFDITGPFHADNVGAGQIQLHTTTGSTILAWCLDIFDDLQKSGTYAVTPNGPINGVSHPADGPHIGGLMAEGNSLIAANHTLTIGTHTFSVAEESAATQIAIWLAEYGSIFTYQTSVSGFSSLVSYIDGHAGTSGYTTLDPDPVNCGYGQTHGCTDPGNQHLGYVPGPLAGAGLPGILAACIGLIVFARRRRQSIA
jgi:hypothetical protein